GRGGGGGGVGVWGAGGEGGGRGGLGDRGEERIERGAALGVIKARNRRGVGGVDAQPIDGLGRKGDETPCGKRLRCALNRGGAGRNDALFRSYHLGGRLRGHRAVRFGSVLAALCPRGL